MWLVGAMAMLCAVSFSVSEWRCPELSARPAAECSCDLPHTLRCAGDHTALQIIGRHLREQKARNKNSAVSLLDCALRGVSALSSASITELAGVGLHGLVISSGDIRRVQQGAFNSVSNTLLALGLPNNQLPTVPTEALTRLWRLDRLDLSNNKIHILESNSFKGIGNLTYLDISDNQLTAISPEAFKPLVKLSVLRLRGNVLKVSTLVTLKEAHLLKDLDLSSNALEGPLGPTTVPSLSYLTTLQISDNTFASIRRGALSGLTNLTHLILHNNQIDVLEDYAFRHLTNLTHLDLSHNEIVAVSGASLAQLTSLSHLDLSHNFLRSLSAEPLKSLGHLTELLLHDNDISMIDDGALAQHKDLGRFTIEDNPLNCDCLMAGFARWLREAKNLSQSDKSDAVCATPPHLEGALLSRLSKNKLCDDFEHTDKRKDDNNDYNKILVNTIDSQEKFIDIETQDVYIDKQEGLDDDIYDEELEIPSEEDLPTSKSKVRLTDAWFDDEVVHLTWSIDPLSNNRYRCTGVTVSRAGGIPKHVACHRAAPGNVLLRGLKLDPIDKYTFCIALEEMDSSDVPLSLVLGCGSPLLVRQRATFATTAPIVITSAPNIQEFRVTEVRSNVTTDGVLTVLVSVSGLLPRSQYSIPRSQRISEARYPLTNCYVEIAVLSQGSLVAQKDIPCLTTLQITMEGFMRGPYEVLFTRCQLTRELLKNNYSRTFLSNWVCLIEQHSDRNTSTFVVKSSRRKYYGLFQIGSEWCKEGRRGGKCEISCEALLDEDIKDDGECALRVFEQEGFKYWSKWDARCKGHTLPDIEKCPDWQHPPQSRISPARDKRTLRGRRSYRRFLYERYRTNPII
ncbi:slit homolog 3 protein [Achroia grisella]|uniref:slit homolog 3 protein n=1 Tax=Achroia grisella TaxID=688607 RepID=UPI0027D262B3|nr:slit homolog 3 protein [Achroia grisella]